VIITGVYSIIVAMSVTIVIAVSVSAVTIGVVARIAMVPSVSAVDAAPTP
jgi:hypothetical protein